MAAEHGVDCRRDMDHTRFNEIAAVMERGEVHSEVREKLDFIQKAFGL